MHCNVAISGLDIELCHHGPTTVLGHHADNLVEFDVMHRECVSADTVIYAVPTRGG